jgi:hypothetical protein
MLEGKLLHSLYSYLVSSVPVKVGMSIIPSEIGSIALSPIEAAYL